jgi:flavin reductase (DIM6/NTAB) family NADH-FMN oxidoreductase RutF
MKGQRLDSKLSSLPLQVAYNPPIISVSFRLSPRQPKNTRDNILATKQFVVNLISEPFVEAANETSVEAPADVSEWDISGLTQEPSVSDRA